MGAWGTGPFENDAAADLLADLAEGEFDFDELREEAASGYLEVDAGQIVLALVELVTAVEEGRRPDGVSDASLAFVSGFDPEARAALRELGAAVVSGSDDSELFELWEESGDLDEWLVPSRAALEKLN